MVNEDRMRHTFEDLVKIDAPSKGEREVCDYLKKKLRALGAAKITEDNNGSVNGGNSGNLIAVFNANTEGLPSIALTAHMDCVENCRGIEPVLEDGVYRSKGDTVLGGDDKAGVAAILEGLALMKETYIPHGKVTVIFTVQEEIGLCGSSSIEENTSPASISAIRSTATELPALLIPQDRRNTPSTSPARASLPMPAWRLKRHERHRHGRPWHFPLPDRKNRR